MKLGMLYLNLGSIDFNDCFGGILISAFTLILGIPGAGTLIDMAGMVRPMFMPSKKPPLTAGQTVELSKQTMHRTIVWEISRRERILFHRIHKWTNSNFKIEFFEFENFAIYRFQLTGLILKSEARLLREELRDALPLRCSLQLNFRSSFGDLQQLRCAEVQNV